jgi:4-diphosphocytidyl-2-C-methyl-D-erythritol kinase
MALVKSFAKINLALEILGKRPDGYHDINTLMQTIDLHDDIECILSTETHVTSNDRSLEGDRNIMFKAVEQFNIQANTDVNVDIILTKRIPVAMGLGGGSSNAAAILVLMNEMTGARLSLDELKIIAISIGSDVPFFLYGGTCYVSGTGEIVEKLKDLYIGNIVLICPKTKLESKTHLLYSLLEDEDFTNGRMVQNLKSNLNIGLLDEKLLYNGFTQAIERFNPSIIEKKRSIENNIGTNLFITGSGMSMFGFMKNAEQYDSLVLWSRDKDIDVFRVNTSSKSLGEHDEFSCY